jgi:CubicO group peptidase (beta-lactamase class C family)
MVMLASVCIVLTISILVIQSSEAAGTEIVSSSIDTEIERMVIEGNIPSFHACVVYQNDNNWVRGFGNETNPDTVFLIGSIQKMFVAVSILQLHEDGLIDIDGDVNDHIPFDIRHPNYPDTEITIRMLLSHRSGLDSTLLPEFCYDWQGVYYPDYRQDYHPSMIGITLGEYLQECLVAEGQYYSSNNWDFEPGTRYGYSNTGFKILMYLLETVSSQTIGEYMQENIFTPLRLNNTGFDASDFEGHHAIPHARNNGSNVELPIWNGEYMMRSTASDMGHFLIALMNEGEFDDYHLLEPDTVEMMLSNTYSNEITFDVRKELRWKGYGLGMDIFSHGLFGHGGSSIGFKAECFFNPVAKLGFVRLTSVGTVLLAQGNDWSDVDTSTNVIRDLVMIHVGLLPQLSVLEMTTIGTVAIFGLFVLRRAQVRYSRSRRQKVIVDSTM